MQHIQKAEQKQRTTPPLPESHNRRNILSLVNQETIAPVRGRRKSFNLQVTASLDITLSLTPHTAASREQKSPTDGSMPYLRDQTPATTLSSLSRDCDTVLDEFVKAIGASEYASIANSLHDAVGRFRVWANNIGAFQRSTSQASLDYRLRDGEAMRGAVRRQLERVKQVTERSAFRPML